MLACAEPGAVYERLAADLGVTTMTVGAWRKRFTQARCDGLVDGHRSGRPKAELVLTDAEPAQLRLSPMRAVPNVRLRHSGFVSNAHSGGAGRLAVSALRAAVRGCVHGITAPCTGVRLAGHAENRRRPYQRMSATLATGSRLSRSSGAIRVSASRRL